MSSATSPKFGRIRAMFWPIHRGELARFIPMLIIYSLIVFNYSILRVAKDTLVITAPSSGAAAIPFIKVWAILPMAFLLTFLFTRLSNRFTRDQVFYFMTLGFTAFFTLFTFVLYPNQELLHPHAIANFLESVLPKGCQGLISIFRNWTFTLFYVMSELWGTTIMTVLFWGFANEVTSVRDAKRFYAILGVGANLATILAAKVTQLISKKIMGITSILGHDQWTQSLRLITYLVIISALIILAIYRKLEKRLKASPIENKEAHRKKPEIKMGMRKNFAYLAKSKYLICIAVIVLTYNISLNMIEVVWKDQMHVLFPNPVDFSAYMAKVMEFIGIVSTIVSVFICGSVIRRFGWTISALVTPIILLVTGIFFFSFHLFSDFTIIAAFSSLLNTSPLVLAVFFGSMQNCLSRASKFTFFDATKEIAFIPLSDECKLKGKAAIDGVGSRIGKSGGALIHQFLLMFFGGVSLSTPYVGGILLLVIVGWLVAVKSLGKRFDALTVSDEKIDIKDDEPSTKKSPSYASTERVMG